MTCTHQIDRSRYVEVMNDWTGEYETEWQERIEHTTRDISIGAYQCTQCGEVMYYTGSWKKHYTEGAPCSSSELADPAETARTREASKTKQLQKERK